MADNTTIDNGALTDYTVADDDDGVAKHQYVKVEWGGDGVFNKVAAGGSALPIQDGGNSLTVDGTVGISGTVVVDTELGAAAALTDNFANPTAPAVGAFLMGWDGAAWDRVSAPGGVIDVNTELPGALSLTDNMANPTVPGVASHLMGYDGTTWDRIRAGTGGTLQVDVARVFGLANGFVPIGDDTFMVVVQGSGQDNVDNTLNQLVTAAMGYVFDGTTWDRLRGDSVGGAFTQGPAATDAAVAGNPLLAGARASTATPTAVSADGDAVPLWALRTGALAVNLRDASGAELAVGGGTQYDEDTASAAAEKVTMAGVVRKDAAASLVDADGDRTELQVDANGALRVTGGGGGTEVTEDAAAAANPTGGMLMARRRDSLSGETDASGDVLALNATNNGELYVKQAGTVTVDTELPAAVTPGDTDSNPTAPEVVGRLSVWNGTQWVRLRSLLGDGVAGGGAADVIPFMWNGTNYDRQRGDTTNGLDVDVTRVQGTVTVDTELSAAAALADNMSNPTTAPVGAFAMGWDGTNWDRIRAPGGVLEVTAPTALEVVGDVAHDAAAPANPVVVGAQMETAADSAPGTRAGTDGDAVKLASMDGAQYMIGGTPQAWSYHADQSAGTVKTDDTVHAAPGAGLSLYVTSIVFSIGAATASQIFFEESTTKVLGPWFLEAVSGRGVVVAFPKAKKITSNTALTVTNTGATTYSIDVEGYIGPG